METHVNSLALPIPKLFASQIGLEPNSLVELSFHDTKLVVAPMKPPGLKLDDLLAQVTEHNLHGEVDTGSAVGGEV